MAEWIVTFLIVAVPGGAIVWWLTHPTTSKPADPVPPVRGRQPGRPHRSPLSPGGAAGPGPLPTTWEDRR